MIFEIHKKGKLVEKVEVEGEVNEKALQEFQQSHRLMEATPYRRYYNNRLIGYSFYLD